VNTITRAVRAYYRFNVRTWEALVRSPANRLPVLVGIYLAVVLGLSASGHTEAAWVATVVMGAPLLAAGWMT
jgi:hypothetical protein